jgi:nucleoside-diphosphate-sugar epimerase
VKVAVTGASGFVGRQVLNALLKNRIEIVAVTRNAARLVAYNGRLSIVEMDIAYPPRDSYDLLGQPDILLHLAWDGLPDYRSSHHVETELPRHFQFLKAMIVAGLPSLLVTGTCFEYGMQSGKLSEDMMPMPDNPYGYAKDALRKQLDFLRIAKPFDLTWTRLFYLYGEGQSKESLYSQLTNAVSRGEHEFKMSKGEQVRDYLPVEEAARSIVLLSLKRSNLGIINICSGKPISVRRIVEQWLRNNNWNIELNLGYYPYPDYEAMAFWGDRRRLDETLGTK